MKKSRHSQFGFTLIEMIVSLAVFSFVATISIGALLMLVAANRQLQGEQSVMTNLSFALDAMTREIRTGTFYYCDSQPDSNGTNNLFNPENDVDRILLDTSKNPPEYKYQDCPTGKTGSDKILQGVAFVEGGDSITQGDQRILYFFNKTEGMVYRRVGGGVAEPIISSGITIKNFEFFVTGSKKQSLGGSATQDQPSVTIYVEAAESADPTAKSYYMQTTVTQRTLDI